MMSLWASVMRSTKLVNIDLSIWMLSLVTSKSGIVLAPKSGRKRNVLAPLPSEPFAASADQDIGTIATEQCVVSGRAIENDPHTTLRNFGPKVAVEDDP